MSKQVEMLEAKIKSIEQRLSYTPNSPTKKTQLTFSEALEWLKKGFKVGRMTALGENTIWCPNHADLLADNWRVIEDE